MLSILSDHCNMEDIKRIIHDILPTMPPLKLDEVCQHLTEEVGVETTEDLSYVEASDPPMLKGIQLKKKLLERWKQGNCLKYL